MSGMKIANLVIITALIATMTPPSHGFGSRNNNCPSDWFTTTFMAIVDVTVDASVFSTTIDSDLTFLRDIMKFSDEEIEQVMQDAMEFFNIRFGLDFSQSMPDNQGNRVLGNATFSPFIVPPEFEYTVTFNSRLLTGSTRNRCFNIREGGVIVRFNGQQTLHGTYGGPEGIPANGGDELTYGFYNIPIFPHHPLVIDRRSSIPLRIEPVDGIRIISMDLYNSILGEGVAQGIVFGASTEDPNRFHLVFRTVFTFPAHPGRN